MNGTSPPSTEVESLTTRYRSLLINKDNNKPITVLPHIFTESECESYIPKLWDFIEDVTSFQIHRNSGEKDIWKHFRSHGAGWTLPVVRERIAEKVYKGLYDSSELWTSKEGFFVGCSGDDSDLRFEGSKEEEEVERTYIRSMVCMSRAKMLFENKHNKETTDITVNAGDVILWRHSTFHHIGATSTGYSFGIYTTMTPYSKTQYNSMRLKKMEAYRTSRTTDHRPDLETYAEEGETLRPFFRYGPDPVSYRQAQLFGLIPYPLTKNDDDDREIILEGMRRGVVFEETYFYDMIPSDGESIQDIISVDKEQRSLELQWNKRRSIECGVPPAIGETLYLPDGEAILGQDKYLGGVASPCNNYIYGVPGFAKQVLSIHIPTNTVSYIGPKVTGPFKWLRGVEIPPLPKYPSGLCVALPSNADAVLKIDPSTNTVSTFGYPIEGEWKYHGGGLHPSTNLIYAIPANASRILVIDAMQDKIWEMGPDYGTGKQKWYGGIHSIYNDCIYAIPHNATSVLKINPNTQECTLHGTLPEGLWKWHGGLITPDGKKIIGFPNNADSVLVVDIPEDRVYCIPSRGALKSGRHRCPHNGKYKYLGGALSIDAQYAYLFPSDAERVLRINLAEETLQCVGPVLYEGGSKYQNGFVSPRDGCIYGIPQNARSVIRIVPGRDGEEDVVDMVYCGEDTVFYKDKFEGGVMDSQGIIYCMPLRAKGIFKVIPPLIRDKVTE